MFYIRVDANKVIAFGHLMRCLSIAAAMRKLGEDVTFLKADTCGDELVVREGFSVITLNTLWNQMEQELPVLEGIVKEKKIEKLLVDSYQVTDQYLERLGEMTAVAYLDDFGEVQYPADIIINYSYTCNRERYRNLYQNTGTNLLLGTKYLPLRDQFQKNVQRKPVDKIKNILVVTGGADICHMLELVLEKLAGREYFSDKRFHLVIGPGVEDHEKLQRQAKAAGNVCCYRNVQNMAGLMEDCDIAVSAAGSTLYELCACKVPTICFAVADNQLCGMQGLVQQQIMLSVGDVRKKERTQLAEEIEEAVRMLEAKEKRAEYMTAMQKVTDGRGAQKLAQALIDFRK